MGVKLRRRLSHERGYARKKGPQQQHVKKVVSGKKLIPHTLKVPDWKKKQVDEIKKLTTTYSTIAIINLDLLPNRQLQKVKKKLKKDVIFKPVKKWLATMAFEASANPAVKQLVKHFGRYPLLIFTNLGAFELFKSLKESRQMVFAKAGQLAPEDIWVSAGPTPFTPGPIISELASLKIKAGVVSGKIEIKADTLVVKKGEKVSPLAAGMLAKLGVTPVKIGVNLMAAVEKGDLYLSNVLDIDQDKFMADLGLAAAEAMALTMGLGIINSDNAHLLIEKAERDAIAVSDAVALKAAETKTQ
ncbi:MAG: 50S ribosomal protein L10 [archaeon]